MAIKNEHALCLPKKYWAVLQLHWSLPFPFSWYMDFCWWEHPSWLSKLFQERRGPVLPRTSSCSVPFPFLFLQVLTAELCWLCKSTVKFFLSVFGNLDRLSYQHSNQQYPKKGWFICDTVLFIQCTTVLDFWCFGNNIFCFALCSVKSTNSVTAKTGVTFRWINDGVELLQGGNLQVESAWRTHLSSWMNSLTGQPGLPNRPTEQQTNQVFPLPNRRGWQVCQCQYFQFLLAC